MVEDFLALKDGGFMPCSIDSRRLLSLARWLTATDQNLTMMA
jgi:hypothetical protein